MRDLPPLETLHRRHVQEGRPLPRALERALEADPRRGARRILEAVRRRRRANRAEGQRLRHLLRFERALAPLRVAGVDEAGMSPLAGPVCAAAVVLPPGWRHPGIDDSKRLDAKTRERLAGVIREAALAHALGWASPEEIDRLNIYQAGLLAMRRAVEALDPPPEHLLVDARRLHCGLPETPLVHGDRRSLSIAAASILAKTARDAEMRRLDRLYPGYGFAQHKGYGVRRHREALARLGPCPIHRRSFSVVAQVAARAEGRGARPVPGAR
ncbi:MAG: ribonuclease HII [Deltaproteobacteria bacterium]|nr:MAG: ribonuclease HII [Deltaproteobacteria bacterium]